MTKILCCDSPFQVLFPGQRRLGSHNDQAWGVGPRPRFLTSAHQAARRSAVKLRLCNGEFASVSYAEEAS
jgi:hypothetical protein